MKTTKIDAVAIEMQNSNIIRDTYKDEADAWLKTSKPYLEIIGVVNNKYTIKLFGKKLGTVAGEENVKMVEAFVKNALIVSGVILP